MGVNERVKATAATVIESTKEFFLGGDCSTFSQHRAACNFCNLSRSFHNAIVRHVAQHVTARRA